MTYRSNWWDVKPCSINHYVPIKFHQNCSGFIDDITNHFGLFFPGHGADIIANKHI